MWSQPPSDRYVSPIFSNYNETTNVLFSSGVPQPNPGGGFYEFVTGYPLNVEEYNTSPIDLYLDVFEPSGDTLKKRPLIIICFGGGFLAGDRQHWSIRLLCQELAKRGFVTAAIDYRLGMNVFDEDLATRAVYRGIQDGRSAVRFFRNDANGPNNFKIDPDQIYIGGHSSGGFIALHNAYLDKEIERPNSTYNWLQYGIPIPDQLCLDCVGNNTSESGHANAVFSLAGALGFTSYIESDQDPNVVMFHSTDDGTVPYDSGTPFSNLIWLVVGADLPDVYGSLPISLQADAVGLPFEFHSYTNRSHGVHEDGSSDLYADIVPKISNWFFNSMLKPKYQNINGDTTVCSTELIQMYTLDSDIGHYFDWQLNGGSFNQMSVDSDTVWVTWDLNANHHSLSVTAYSELDARGDSLGIDINVYAHQNNTFLGFNSDWTDPMNWSEMMLPQQCHDVFIADSIATAEVNLTGLQHINSLYLGKKRKLNLPQGSSMSIYQKSSSFVPHALSVEGQIFNHGSITIRNKQSGKEVKVISDGAISNLEQAILEIGTKN